MTEKYIRCPKCRRMVLASRMVDHNLFAQADHSKSFTGVMSFSEAYNVLKFKSESEEVYTNG